MENSPKGQCPVCETLIDFTGSTPLATVKCPSCDSELILPWEFGKYLLTEKEEIENYFFEFFLGYDNRDNKKIRLAMLKKDIEEYSFWVDKCKTEATFLRTLLHKNVVPIIDDGMQFGHYYYAEPCLDGFSIEEYDPNKVGELEVQSVIEFGKKLALALDAIHHKAFIHHNIEPKNIFIEKDGEVKIINLLLSRIEYFNAERKGLDQFAVSPYYISPEKAEKGKEESMGDVFSFGVFLYYFLTGEYPYNGDTENEIIFSRIKRRKSNTHTNIEYLVPNSIVSYRGDEIREKVSLLIEKLIKPYPIQRPSAGEFVTELKLIDAEEDRIEAEEKRRHFLDNTKTVRIPTMRKLSKEK